MDVVIGAVIGGAIALIDAMIVQWFVIPLVNRRTRAIDRWEQRRTSPAAQPRALRGGGSPSLPQSIQRLGRRVAASTP